MNQYIVLANIILSKPVNIPHINGGQVLSLAYYQKYLVNANNRHDVKELINDSILDGYVDWGQSTITKTGQIKTILQHSIIISKSGRIFYPDE